MEFPIVLATLNDIVGILDLYQLAYTGLYPDRSFHGPQELRQSLLDDSKRIYLVKDQGKVIACLLFLYNEEYMLGKAGGAVVHPDYRGHNITQKMIEFGIKDIQNSTRGLEVLYITTRTVHKAAQVLTANMGFKQLGIFPNVHKTRDYETHALAAMYFGDALSKRYESFEQHPDIYNLFEIVRENISLPAMKKADLWTEKNYYGEVPALEVVDSAPSFTQNRYKKLKASNEIDLAFFPFHKPNLWITSPAENIELFAYVNEYDKHCVILGCKIDREVSFTDLFLKVSNLLRDRGIRYIEVIIRANRMNILNKVLGAKFIPCGYLPAFQSEGEKRYDYAVFSRSFEVLDFNNLQLTGANERYLRNYISLWESKFLGNYFKK